MKKIITTLFALGALFWASPSLANGLNLVTHDSFHALIVLIGGLAFLLYGFDKLTSATKTLAGGQLKKILAHLTKDKKSAFFTGIASSAVMQSSAAVTAMLVGFISSKLITLHRSLIIILGADIGTTIAVQLIAFRLNQYALLLIAIGFLLRSQRKNDHFFTSGQGIIAVGMIFLGIFLMSESIVTLEFHPWAQHMIHSLGSPLTAFLVGALATALVHSSTAVLAIAIALTSQHLINLESIIFIVMGANFGTIVTATLVANRTDNKDAHRTAAGYILFKLGGVLFFIPLSFYLPEFLLILDSNATIQEPTARMVAHTHTLFNLLLAVLFLPFSDKLADWLIKVMPTKPHRERIAPEYLNTYLVDTPSFALNAARSEINRIASIVREMLNKGLPLAISGESSNLHELKRLDSLEKDIDALYRQTLHYLGLISKQNLTEKESNELLWLTSIINRLENISDLVGTEMMDLTKKRLQRDISIDEETQEKISEIAEYTIKGLAYSTKPLASLEQNISGRSKYIDRDEFKMIFNHITRHQIYHLSTDKRNDIQLYAMETEILDRIQRVFYHARKIATDTVKFVDSQKKSGEQLSLIDE